MAVIDLDIEDLSGPNPPPWEIHYINDRIAGIWYNGILPEARTVGLSRICGLELIIRLAPPNVASPVLDNIGLWLLKTRQKLKINDQIKVFGIIYTIVPILDQDRPAFRLAWQKDPPPTSDQIIALCQRFKDDFLSGNCQI